MLSDSGRVRVAWEGSVGEVGALLSCGGTSLCDVLSNGHGLCDSVLPACCPVELLSADVADV